jgi:hypothetical protein
MSARSGMASYYHSSDPHGDVDRNEYGVCNHPTHITLILEHACMINLCMSEKQTEIERRERL